MYIRLPKSPVTQNYERIASFGDGEPLELCLLRKPTRCILLRMTANKKKQQQVFEETLDYILSDRQLNRHRVITNDISFVADYAFEYMSVKDIRELVNNRLSEKAASVSEPVLIISSYHKDIAEQIMESGEDRKVYYFAIEISTGTANKNAHPGIPVISIDDTGCTLGYDGNSKVPMIIYLSDDEEAREFYKKVSKKREDFAKSISSK